MLKMPFALLFLSLRYLFKGEWFVITVIWNLLTIIANLYCSSFCCAWHFSGMGHQILCLVLPIDFGNTRYKCAVSKKCLPFLEWANWIIWHHLLFTDSAHSLCHPIHWCSIRAHRFPGFLCSINVGWSTWSQSCMTSLFLCVSVQLWIYRRLRDYLGPAWTLWRGI